MKYLSICVLFAFALGLLAGCGGGGSNDAAANKGAASFTIVWPERSRLIPLRAESIKIDATQGGRPVATSQVVARPASGTNTSTVTFPQLPIGNVDITATAYPVADPTADPTAVPQAVGSITVRINPDQTTQATLTMDSTIFSLVLNVPNALRFTLGDPGLTIGVSARDVDGNVVLLPTDDSPPTLPSTLSFQSTDTAVVTVDADGFVTPVASGDAQIIITETESNVSATVSVSVRGQVATLSISPNNPTIAGGVSQALNVTARDAGGNVVEVDPGDIRWTTDNVQRATVTNANQPDGGERGGSVTGISIGTAQVIATHTLTGATDGVTVTVSSTIATGGAITIDPGGIIELAPGDQLDFAAFNAAGESVNPAWTATGPGNVDKGTIDAAGQYVAPGTAPGVPITITATVGNETGTAIVVITQSQ